jgi:type I restriction enzyme S subunit
MDKKKWVSCCLGDILAVKNGYAFKSTEYQGDGIPIIRISDIKDGIVGIDTAKCINPCNEFDNYAVNSGDLLIAMSGATTGKFGVYNGSKKAYQNQRVGNLKPFSDALLSKKFIYYLLHSLKRQIEKEAYGGAQPNISSNKIELLQFYLPPLSEQYRIVAKIETLFSELDKGIESFKTAREQLKIYRQALLKQAFSGKLTEKWRAENPDKLESAEALLQRIQTERLQRYQQQLKDWETNGKQGSKPKPPKVLPPLTAEELAELPELPSVWNWTRLGNTNVDVSDGPFGSNLKSSDYVDSGVRVIRLENIGQLEFIENKESYVTNEKYELLKNHTVTSGDMIFSSFITENVRVAIVPPSITKAINKADCFCIRVCGETLSNYYIVMFLSSRRVFKQLESQIHGVGRPRINTTQLKEVVIPVCGAEEQKVIIAELESNLSKVDQLDQTINTALQQAEALRQSILKKAFSGQLVPQDPNDEPASVLLERIRSEKAQADSQPTRRRGKTA